MNFHNLNISLKSLPEQDTPAPTSSKLCSGSLLDEGNLNSHSIDCVCLLVSFILCIWSQTMYYFFFLRKVTLQVPVSVCPDHPSEVPEKLIQDRFRKLGRFPEAFSSIHYKGTRTYNPPTDFSGLRRALEQQLENNTTRSPRHPGVIFKALKVSWLLP